MPITIASIMNLVGPDMMVILLIVLLLFGAKKLPELAREWVGRSRSSARRAMKLAGSLVSPAPARHRRTHYWTQRARYRLRSRSFSSAVSS
jgi:TatA/E family protein of Tat protein translocase